MPFFWYRERSNFVAIKFGTPSAEKVAETFATPEKNNIDNGLVDYIKTMSVGDAIEINLKESGIKSERSLKVRIGKHAKLANRELEARSTDGGANFIFRVSAIIEEPVAQTNGTTEGANETASARGRR